MLINDSTISRPRYVACRGLSFHYANRPTRGTIFAIEEFSWFLVPNVNNTPAFITVSKWLVQSLAVANLLGYFILKLLIKYKFTNSDWRLSSHLIFSIVHIMIVGFLIFAIAGFEDL